MPMMPTTTPKMTGPWGICSRRIFRPVRIADELMPITASTMPMIPVVHDTADPSTHAHTSRVPMTRSDPGRIGMIVPRTPTISSRPATTVTVVSTVVVSMTDTLVLRGVALRGPAAAGQLADVAG